MKKNSNRIVNIMFKPLYKQQIMHIKKFELLHININKIP